MITPEEFKLYARIDHDDEDELITGLVTAASLAVSDMTGKLPPHGSDELYDVAVMQLAAHWYENRTPIETGANVMPVPFTLQTLLNHISLSSRYPELEGGDGEDDPCE